MANEAESTLYTNRWHDTSDLAPGGTASYRDICPCFDQYQVTNRRRVRFHNDRQDTSSPAWQHLLALIEEAAADGREVFRPLADLSPQQRRQIVTLPPTIAKLTEVRHFNLYGSNLVRIPPEIGAMTALQEFTPYTSYRLHWLPYELTRCQNLQRSTVSTRALYGNEKLRPPFPPLRPRRPVTAASGPDDEPTERDATEVSTCSVCERSLDGTGVHRAWISLRIATDVLPLLVNACSAACVQALPTPAEHYVQAPHAGGPGIVQPTADYA